MDDPVGISEVFDWTTVDDGVSVEVGDQTWTFATTEHYVPTLSVRVESGGRCFVFSADTGPNWSPAPTGEPVDLFLCESTFAERAGNEEILHLSAGEAAELAAAADVGHLVLTHLSPGQDPEAHAAAASAVFDGAISVAEVGATYSV